MPNKEDEIGGLYDNTTRDGEVYMKGRMNGEKVVIFRNKWKKEGERTPDWRVYKSQPRDGQAIPQPATPQPTRQPDPVYDPPYSEEDIPF